MFKMSYGRHVGRQINVFVNCSNFFYELDHVGGLSADESARQIGRTKIFVDRGTKNVVNCELAHRTSRNS